MTSLRTIEGLDLLLLKGRFGEDVIQKVEVAAAKYLRSGKMSRQEPFLKLTREGKFLADGIAADLFI